MMKKVFSMMLVACLLTVPARAMEIADQPGEVSPKEDQVVVATFDEMQAAINSAEDGDIIYISQPILINEQNSIDCDINVTIARAEKLADNKMIIIEHGGKISGLTFLEESDKSDENAVTITIDNTWALPAIIQNCNFIGDNTYAGSFITVYGGIDQGNVVQMMDCSFSSSGRSSVSTRSNTNVTLTNCTFNRNRSTSTGGAIQNTGNMLLENCEIQMNSAVSGGGVFNSSSGKMTINNCNIYGNAINTPLFGTDIFSWGTITITGSLENDMYLYDEATGEKQTLPIENIEEKATFICLSDEEAAKFFAPKLPLDEETDPPAPGDNGGTTGNEQTSEGTGDVGNAPTETDLSQDSSGSDITDPPTMEDGKPTDTPDRPAQPPQTSDTSEDDYTHHPIYRPIQPTVTAPETQPEQKPANNPALAQPQLICNGAIVDTSRTVILLGYGDGFAHETDNLTRAQLAAIIYRLLDDETIARYSHVGTTFDDVPIDAWYAPYVSAIGAAGIVNGVGGNSYNPNGIVTWAQIIMILSRFVEPQEYTLQHIQYSGWAARAIETAVALHWIEDSTALNPEAVINRGEVTGLVNEVLAMYR